MIVLYEFVFWIDCEYFLILMEVGIDFNVRDVYGLIVLYVLFFVGRDINKFWLEVIVFENEDGDLMDIDLEREVNIWFELLDCILGI